MNEQSVPNPAPLDEEQLLEGILDRIGSQKPDLVEALRLCAIPHWFDAGLLAWLRGDDPESLQQAEALLSEMRQNRLAFDSTITANRGYRLHDRVRNRLLADWRNSDAMRFRELSGKAAAYCARMLEAGTLTRKQRTEWEREEMYHLLAAEPERGLERLDSLASRAIDTYGLATLNTLLGLARQQADGGDARILAWVRFFEGKKDLVSGRWEQARKTWEGLQAKRAQAGPQLEKTLAVHLAILYKDRGEWDRAIDCFQDSLRIAEGAGDPRGTITILNNRGFMFKDREEWKKAEGDFRRGLELAESLDDKHAIARALKNLGLLYKDHRKWEQAIESFQASLKNYRKMNDARGLAAAYSDLGFLYKDRKEWDLAIKCFRQSEKSLDLLRDEHGKAAAFNSLGFLYTNKQDWKKAAQNFERALELLEHVGDERRQADTFSYLGILYRNKKEWDKAEGYLRQSLRILEELKDERGLATCFHNLGLLYKSKRDWKKAADYFRQSLKIVERVHDELNAATTMHELALMYRDMQKYDQAIRLLNKVVRVLDTVGHPDLRVRKSREELRKIKAKAAASVGARNR